MNKVLFLISFLMIAFDHGQAQEQISEHAMPPINLNQLILKIEAHGDSSLTASNFLSAEKYFKESCAYTDTLILLAAGKFKTTHYTITRKHIHQHIASYEKLAKLYQMSGNMNKSQELYLKSIQQRQLVFDEHSVHRVPPYIGLGQLYFHSEDFDKALYYFSEGSQLLDKATTTNYNFDVLRYQLYGFHFETSLQKGRYREAYRYLQRYFYALNTVIPTKEQIAAAFEMKARYYLVSGSPSHVNDYIKRAEGFLPSSNIIFSTAKVKVLRTKALNFWSQHLFDSTLITFEKLLHVYKSNIRTNFPSLSEYEREQFFIVLKKDFDLYNSFAAESIRSGHSPGTRMSTLYNTQLFTKALLLNEITKSKRAIEASHDVELISQMNQWQKLKERIANLYYTDKKASAEINLLDQQINTLEKDINQKSNYLNKAGEDIQWQQIRDHLKEQEAAIEIIRTKRFHIDSIQQKGIRFSNEVQYLVLAVQSTSQTPEGSLLSEGSDLETKYIAQYRNCIRQQQEDTISYNLFWKPIQNRLSDSHTFFISSDGVYNQINLNVLRNPASHQYVLDEVNIYLVTNTKDILQSTDKINMASASLFGKPDYTVNTSMNPERPNPNRSLQAISDRDLVNFTDQDFDDLPGTELEVKSIESVFLSRQWSIHTFLNENATEENIKSVESPSVLHIATHGFFLEDDGSHINSMIRSGIILAGIKNHSDQRAQDGILTAYETTGLALEKTNLVVLSACETGLGEVMNGEGVYGLQRGLKVAGAKNLLMSLWKVDDKATAELMINFYQKWLSGLPIHDAFKKAQMDLRQNYESPFYWGAFILIGN